MGRAPEKNVALPTAAGLWGGVKRSKISNLQKQSQFQRFLFIPNGVFLQIGGIKIYRTGFSNIVMWHIKLTGMMSRTECKVIFYPMV